jgi:carbonic anhydrase
MYLRELSMAQLAHLSWRPRVALQAAVFLFLLTIGMAAVTLTNAQVPPPPAGTAQSPIDIDTQAAVEQNLPRLRFDYPRKMSLEVVNTGSPDEFATVRANMAPGEARLRVGPDWYGPLQFHWHTPGEHELDGRGYPMEMHLVHQREGAAGLEGLLVVGVWM